jgi:transketolase
MTKKIETVDKKMDQLGVNTIRTLAMDAVQQANSARASSLLSVAKFSTLRSRPSNLA